MFKNRHMNSMHSFVAKRCHVKIFPQRSDFDETFMCIKVRYESRQLNEHKLPRLSGKTLALLQCCHGVQNSNIRMMTVWPGWQFTGERQCLVCCNNHNSCLPSTPKPETRPNLNSVQGKISNSREFKFKIHFWGHLNLN